MSFVTSALILSLTTINSVQVAATCYFAVQPTAESVTETIDPNTSKIGNLGRRDSNFRFIDAYDVQESRLELISRTV